jgi:hypothetical protein
VLNVNEKLWLVPSDPLSHPGLSLVLVWLVPSRLVHIMVVPTFTVWFCGLNASPCMVLFCEVGGQVAVAEGVIVGVFVRVFVGVLVCVDCCVGVRVTVLVADGVRVVVFVGATVVVPQLPMVMRRVQAFREPTSAPALSLIVRVQVPFALCPLKPFNGLLGVYDAPEVGGQTEPIAAAAASSRVILLMLSWLPHMRFISTTVVLAGEVNCTIRSFM